jgi:hypothetical protein
MRQEPGPALPKAPGDAVHAPSRRVTANDDVTIDLGGFTIVGPNFATPPASCTSGTGFGTV